VQRTADEHEFRTDDRRSSTAPALEETVREVLDDLTLHVQ
jgi:hypothetical protein